MFGDLLNTLKAGNFIAEQAEAVFLWQEILFLFCLSKRP